MFLSSPCQDQKQYSTQVNDLKLTISNKSIPRGNPNLVTKLSQKLKIFEAFLFYFSVLSCFILPIRPLPQYTSRNATDTRYRQGWVKNLSNAERETNSNTCTLKYNQRNLNEIFLNKSLRIFTRVGCKEKSRGKGIAGEGELKEGVIITLEGITWVGTGEPLAGRKGKT